MSIRKFLTGVAVSTLLTLAAAPARAGIPVFDASSLAQQIQQVVAWGKQADQMIEQINRLNQQFQQLQTMTQKLDGARGLGTIQNDPNILAVLPPEMRDLAQYLLNPAAAATSETGLNQIRTAFGVGSTLDPAAGLSAADALGRSQQILASTQLRQAQVQALAARVDGTADAKESLDMLNRNVLEAASINNQMVQTMAALEAARLAAELKEIARHQEFANGLRTGGARPIKTYSY